MMPARTSTYFYHFYHIRFHAMLTLLHPPPERFPLKFSQLHYPLLKKYICMIRPDLYHSGVKKKKKEKREKKVELEFESRDNFLDVATGERNVTI